MLITMYGNFILLVFFSLLIFINGQYDEDKQIPIAQYLQGRISKQTFDTQFTRGRCPQRFYQVGDECIYFATDGKSYSWTQIERVCSRRIARILDEPSIGNSDQPNMKPTRGVRQLVLNTPEKTNILRAMYRDYEEQNYGIRIPYDYNTLKRCMDGKDDKWPQFCTNSKFTNTTCYETISYNPEDICLREVDCEARYLRLTCEFTLPGSPEITNSKFRNCPPVRGRFGRLPRWAWFAIIIGGSLLVLTILAAIFGFIFKSKRNANSSKKRSLPEPRELIERPKASPKRREDPSAEPMLVRATPNTVTDTGYLQPRSSLNDNTENA